MTILGIFLAVLIGLLIRSIISKKLWGNKIYRTPWWVIVSFFILSGTYMPSAIFGLMGLFMYDMISYAVPSDNASRKIIKGIHENITKGIKANA